MSNDCYVYMYIDPFTNIPFYVGMGKNKRYLQHLHEAITASGKQQNKINKIKSILSRGENPVIIKIEQNMSRDEAFELEEFLISFIGRKDINTGPLTNKTAGGIGGKEMIVTEEIKKSRKKSINEKYGVDYITQCPEIKTKIKKNNKLRYGYECTLTVPAFKEKSKQTCLQKYGAECFQKTENSKENARKRFNALYEQGQHWIQNNKEVISENTLRQVKEGKHPFKTQEHKERQRKICQEKNTEMNKIKSQRQNVKELKEKYKELGLKQPRGGIWVKPDSWINSELQRLSVQNPFGEVL